LTGFCSAATVRAPVRSISRVLAVAALLVLASGCGQGARAVPGPLDRFTYPTGLTLAPLGDGRRALVVVSSNFDLRYSSEQGGTVIAVDPDASLGDHLEVLGAARIGSFGGEAAVLSGAPLPALAGSPVAPPTCPGWTGANQVLVPSRDQDALYRVDLDAAGGLSCGSGCKIALNSSLADPYGVQIACREVFDTANPAQPAVESFAYVSHLRAPQNKGWLSKLDLSTGALSLVDLGPSPPHSFAWDAARARLYVTGRFGVIDLAALRWLDPLFAPDLVHVANFGFDVRGAELRSMALSSDGTRAYVAMRLFNRDLASSTGVRLPDVAGALAVIDLVESVVGAPEARILRLVPVGVGPNQVAVLPRTDGRRDVVAITNTDEGTVVLYDDASQAIATVLGTPGATLPASFPTDGKPLFGKQPFGLASEPRGPATRRLYVGSFDRGHISVLDVDLDQPSKVAWVSRFGREVQTP
jgi:hypothetical protein